MRSGASLVMAGSKEKGPGICRAPSLRGRRSAMASRMALTHLPSPRAPVAAHDSLEDGTEEEDRAVHVRTATGYNTNWNGASLCPSRTTSGRSRPRARERPSRPTTSRLARVGPLMTPPWTTEKNRTSANDCSSPSDMRSLVRRLSSLACSLSGTALLMIAAVRGC